MAGAGGDERRHLERRNADETFDGRGYYTPCGANVGRTCDVSTDGQRFLMINAPGAVATGMAPTLIVVQHFDGH